MAAHRLTVPKPAPARLDVFLSKAVPGVSLERARALLAQGRVRVDGKVAKPARRLWGGEAVEVDLPAPRAAVRAGGPPLPLLYEDAHLLVVDKPAGLSSEDERGGPSVVSLLAAQVPGLDVGGVAQPGVAHRLDKDTTGCLALARTDEGLSRLQLAFEEKRVDKQYLALVLGAPPDAAALQGPYARDPRDPRRYTTKAPSARRARLSYRTVERFDGFALLQVTLDTGRTHQIRVQLSEAGYPLLGDPLYGTRASREHPAAVALGRTGLHAVRLCLVGVADAAIDVSAPLPDDFRSAMSRPP